MLSTIGRFSLLTLPLVVGVSLLASCGSNAEDTTSASESKTLFFSAIPDDNKTELASRYQLLADYLTEKLEVPVSYNASSSYTASVEAFKAGDIQLAWFGGGSGVQARNAVEGAHAIAQGKVDPKYKSYFIANVNSGLTPSDSFPMEMEGKTFAFGSPGSTSGRIMPEYFLKLNTGKGPEEFFGHPNKFSGSHDLTAEWVQDGTVQCGAMNYKTYDRLVASGKIDPAKCIKIWTTPDYPDYNWTAHPDLDKRFGAGFTARLQKVLVDITDPKILKALDRPEGLITATSADFDTVATKMRELGLLR
ncbi:MAG: putative selenate ABC transporter substrate-binding protein [Planctomycetes bacterium]|nr:putative selenate ABC transporter substrate-binding protein [Planctomycetota bacterium]